LKILIKIFHDVDEENADVVFCFGEKEKTTIFGVGEYYREYDREMRFDFVNQPNKSRLKNCMNVKWFGSWVNYKPITTTVLDFGEDE
jgi:hypothetical protein